ncbi:MAG: SRPBCC domain-containing protein [Mucilaginibacter sp.]
MTETSYNNSIIINAKPTKIWEVLTNRQLMPKWMAETEIEIITDWQVGSSIVIRGDLHGMPFENNGRVLQFEPEKLLHYNLLSTLSNLPDEIESYSIIEFCLQSTENQTVLTLTLSNFPTEAIYRHLAFYWSVTLEMMREFVEQYPSKLQPNKL